MTEANGRLWIGLVDVRPRNERSSISEGGAGAFSQVIAVANTAEAFKERIAQAADQLGLFVVEVEDVEAFENRRRRFFLPDDLIALADKADESGEVEFNQFHVYPSDD